MYEWDGFGYCCLAIMSKAFLKFLVKRIYGLEGDGG